MQKRALISFVVVGTVMLVGAGCNKPTPTPITPPVVDTTPLPVEGSKPMVVPGEKPDIDTEVIPENEAAESKRLPAPAPAQAPTPATTPVTAATVKTFTVTGDNFSYDVKTMTVKQGDKVRVVFKNAEGMHDWKLDEFNAATKKIGAGKEEIIEFIADKKGTFEYYCSVGSHRANGMKGTLTVE